MHLDAGTSALVNCIGNSCLWRVDHAHQADKAEILEGEVGLVPIGGEVEALGELGGVKVEVDEAKDALPHTSQGFASLNEDLLRFLCQCHLLPLQ